MVVIAWKHASHLVQGRAADDLCLRVIGTARDGQVVKLSAPKCTIGSARGCTLRLQAAGVRPLQCVILRGLRGTVARCWSAGTRLNGQPFTDAQLAAGDRLAIGPIELEVLDSSAAEPLCSDRTAEIQAVSPSSPSECAPCDGQRARADRQRVHQLIVALRGLKAEVARLHEGADQTTRVEQIAEAPAADLERSREAFQRECQQWEATRTATEAELAARDNRLASELGQLETERNALAQDQTNWKSLQASEASRLAQAATRLEEQQAEFQRAQEQFEKHQQSLRDEHDQAAAQLEAARQCLEQERLDFQGLTAEQNTTYEQRRAELQRHGSELEDGRNALAQREAKLAQLETQHQSVCDEVQGNQAEFERQAAASSQQLEAERAAWQRERAEADADRRQRTDELDQLLNEVKQQRAQMQREQAELAQSRAKLDSALADLEQERKSLDAERRKADSRLARETEELEGQRVELEAQPAETMAAAQAERDEMESEADEAPEAAYDEEDPGEDEEDASKASAEPEEPEPIRSSASPRRSDEEPSVEEYMEGLLSRMRGGRPAEVAPPPQPKRNKRKSDAGSQAVQPKTDAVPAEVRAAHVVDMPSTLVEMTRRPQVQQTTDLSAMRELANTQARIAIDIHGKKRLLNKALGSMSAALVTLSLTFVVLSFVADDEALRNGAMVGVVAGIYWMLGGAKALQQMITQRRAKIVETRERLEKSEARKTS